MGPPPSEHRKGIFFCFFWRLASCFRSRGLRENGALASSLRTNWWGVALLHVGEIRREERHLEQKFGGNYLRYKYDVARYIDC